MLMKAEGSLAKRFRCRAFQGIPKPLDDEFFSNDGGSNVA